VRPLGRSGHALLVGEAAEERMELGALFVVARGNVDLYEYVKHEFAGEPVTVIRPPRR
jgi:hypothetical protein